MLASTEHITNLQVTYVVVVIIVTKAIITITALASGPLVTPNEKRSMYFRVKVTTPWEVVIDAALH